MTTHNPPDVPENELRKTWFQTKILDPLSRGWEAIVKSVNDFIAAPVVTIREFVSKVFFLRIHRDSNLTTEVKIVLGSFTLILFAIAAFETFAWSSLWSLTGIHPGWVWVLTAVFVIGITLLDRSILVMPVASRWKFLRVIAVRAVFLVGLSFITAIPVELMVFRQEIEQVFQEREAAAAKELRKEKVAETLELAKAQAAAITSANEGVTKIEGDRRLGEKKLLMDKHEREKAAILKRQASVQRKLDREQGRKNEDRDADRIRQFKSELKSIKSELKAYEDTAKAEIDAFEKKTDEQVAAARAATESAATKQGETLKSDVAAVGEKSNDELAAEMKGSYKQARGLKAYIEVLWGILTKDPISNAIGWVVRLVMVTAGVIMFLAKMFMTTEAVAAYLSPASQYANGNKEVGKSLRTRAMEVGGDALTALCSVVQGYGQDVSGDEDKRKDLDVIRTLARKGESEAFDVVALRARAHEDDEDLKIVREHASKYNSGKRTAIISEAFRIVRVRARSDRNEADRTIVESFGMNPDEAVAFQGQALTDAAGQVRAHQRLVHEQVIAYREGVTGFCTERVPSPDGTSRRALDRRVINDKAKELWRKTVAPAIDKLIAAEFEVRRQGGHVPSWPSTFTERDPRPTNLPEAMWSPEDRLAWKRVWELTDQELVDEYGWEAPSSAPVVPIRSTGGV